MLYSINSEYFKKYTWSEEQLRSFLANINKSKHSQYRDLLSLYMPDNIPAN
jgi:hypothetical protein